MPEYIEREALINSIEDNPHLPVSRIIKEVPAADVAPVVHGEWETSDTPLGKCCVCSVCGSCPTMEYKYCPYCGAKMDGGDKTMFEFISRINKLNNKANSTQYKIEVTTDNHEQYLFIQEMACECVDGKHKEKPQ